MSGDVRRGRGGTTSFELARVLTPENLDAVLPRFFGLSRREAMEVAATMLPAQIVPERTLVTPVREPAPVPAMVLVAPAASEATTAAPVAAAPSPDLPCLPVGIARPVPGAARAEVQPLTGERSRIHVTVDRGFERAGHCCQWELASGGVCGSRRRLEPDHIRPLALGGTSELANIRILCAFHNLLAAREVFGDEWMDRFATNPRAHPHRSSGHGAGSDSATAFAFG